MTTHARALLEQLGDLDVVVDPAAMRAARAAMVNVRETRRLPFKDVELRAAADGKTLTFTGYACVTDEPYEMFDWYGSYTEVVRGGAFDKTLAEGADVAFLVNHEGMTLARTKSETLRLAADTVGLHVEASLDPANPTIMSVRSAMDRKDMDEMSFAFRVLRQLWSPDYDQRDITEVSIDRGDVSLVNYGANPATAGATLRSFRAGLAAGGVSLRTFAAALTELRAGAALSATNVATLKHVLSLLSAADNAVDEGQEVLAGLLGVPNPDVEDDPAGDTPAEVEADPEAKSQNVSLFAARAAALALQAR